MNILDTVLGPLLTINPLLSIIIISFILSLLITIAYKFLTNQSLMKDLRDEQNSLQKKLKELKNHPEKAMKVQSEMMEINMKYMTHSMRPTLVTFIPIILIFGWLNANMAYYPLYPNMPFEVNAQMKDGTIGNVNLILPQGLSFAGESKERQELINNKAMWFLKGPTGEYNLTFSYNEMTVSKKILVTDIRKYYAPEENFKNSYFKQVTIGNLKVKPFDGIPLIGGWGWLGAYIIFSLIFSMGLRRLMKLY
ncbi:MAG: EMC3/TMCO1 family protein [archaeon]